MQQVSCSRGNPAGEWLQAALALSIEKFFEDPSRPCGNRGRPGCLNRSIGGHERAWRRAHPPHRELCEGDRTVSTKTRATHGGRGGPGFPLMTQLAKPAGAEVGVNDRRGVLGTKFRYSAHSGPAATRWRSRRWHNRQYSCRRVCTQIDEEPKKTAGVRTCDSRSHRAPSGRKSLNQRAIRSLPGCARVCAWGYSYDVSYDIS